MKIVFIFFIMFLAGCTTTDFMTIRILNDRIQKLDNRIKKTEIFCDNTATYIKNKNINENKEEFNFYIMLREKYDWDWRLWDKIVKGNSKNNLN